MSTPELELSEDESKKFAGSLARISSLYDDKINPRIVAWVDLLSVAGAIYGPRVIAIRLRMQTEKAASPAPQSTATPINTRRATAPEAARTGPVPRSPVELFGAESFGAAIPDAV